MENTYTHAKTHSLDFINKQMDKKGLNKLLAQIYLEFGGAKTAELADTLKNLGYKYATRSGVTISIADLTVPESKKELLKEAEQEIEVCHRQLIERLEKPERKLVLRIMDTQNLMAEERSMDSFLCGFHLALEMANELNYYKQDRQPSSTEEAETDAGFDDCNRKQ